MTVVADTDLPLWSIRPDWKNGILERLEWLTDVIKGDYGTEQRRALRLSPRRTFEVGFVLTDQERAFADLWLHRFGTTEFMLPLWHDQAMLTADINIGATALPCDTTFREFEVGGLAIVVGPDAFTCDKVTVTAITDMELTVAGGGITRAYPAGTSVHPLRRARLEDESAAAAITSRVGQGTLRFELNQANDIADEGTWPVLYAGYPIILEEPNRREDLTLTFQRNGITVDNDTGLRELYDGAGRAFTIQKHLLMLVGREELFAFRQLAYRLRGQQGAVWMPSFNNDVELTRDRLAADAVLDIKEIGYAYTGGAVAGRQHILIGTLGCKVTGTAAALGAGEERLTLEAALGEDIPAGEFGSFMDTCRLSSDAVEIQHITDSDGVAEATLSFRSFRDERTTPDPIDSPIPAAVRSDVNCGTPESATCVPDLPGSDAGDPLAPGTGPGSGGGDGGDGDPPTASALAAVLRATYTATGPEPFTTTPTDIADRVHIRLYVKTGTDMAALTAAFPELTGITPFAFSADPFASSNGGVYLSVGGLLYHDAGDIDGLRWHLPLTPDDDPAPYFTAAGGAYDETNTFYDLGDTVAKTRVGIGAKITVGAGPETPADSLPALEDVNLAFAFLDFKQFYLGTP